MKKTSIIALIAVLALSLCSVGFAAETAKVATESVKNAAPAKVAKKAAKKAVKKANKKVEKKAEVKAEEKK